MIGAGFSSLSPQISFFSENIISTINCWRFEKSSPVIVHGYLLWNGKRGEKEALYEGILFSIQKRKGSIRLNWNCKCRRPLSFFSFHILEFNVNLLSQVLELDKHERNMWPISVINLTPNCFSQYFLFKYDPYWSKLHPC